MTETPPSFDAEDWLVRFERAGCAMVVDPVGMRPSPEIERTPRSTELWAEIRGTDNVDRWSAVHDAVRRRLSAAAGQRTFPPHAAGRS